MNAYSVSVMGRGEKIHRLRMIRARARGKAEKTFIIPNSSVITVIPGVNWFKRMWRKFVSIFDKNNFYQSPPSAWPQ